MDEYLEDEDIATLRMPSKEETLVNLILECISYYDKGLTEFEKDILEKTINLLYDKLAMSKVEKKKMVSIKGAKKDE